MCQVKVNISVIINLFAQKISINIDYIYFIIKKGKMYFAEELKMYQ